MDNFQYLIQFQGFQTVFSMSSWKLGVACRHIPLLPDIQQVGPYRDSRLTFLLQVSPQNNSKTNDSFSMCHLESSVSHVVTSPSCLTFNEWVLTDTPTAWLASLYWRVVCTMCVQDSLGGNAKTLIIANVSRCCIPSKQNLHSSISKTFCSYALAKLDSCALLMSVRYVQDSLGGNAKTMIMANVSPCRMCAQETLSTLQFASRAKHIRNKAVINQDTNGDVAMLQREVLRLRR